MGQYQNRYKTFIFDCDGVVLNSNKVKTEAFYKAALPYGEAAAQALVDYHVTNGGVSRYQKFAHFLSTMVPPTAKGPGLKELLAIYAQEVQAGLLDCEVAQGLAELRQRTLRARWLICSGGDQAELREVFAARRLDALFDGGIFGSPATKDEILERQLDEGSIVRPALFIGDSRYDHQAAVKAGLDFVFVSQWTEFVEWRSYVRKHKISVVETVADLYGHFDGPRSKTHEEEGERVS